MTDRTQRPEEAVSDPNDGSPVAASTGMPRWVKVSLIVVGVLIAVFLILKVAGLGGGHGPSRHMGPDRDDTKSSETGAHTPPPGMDHSR